MTEQLYSEWMRGTEMLQQLSVLQAFHHKRQLIIQQGKTKLYHYAPLKKKIHSTPLLIVFATVNRPDILDLMPEHSFIGNLLKQGLDIYLLDWGYPDAEDVKLTLTDYVKHIDQSVYYVKKLNQKAKRINLLGVCQGGVLCLAYAARAQDIKNLILLSTPVDFQTENNLPAKLLAKFDVNAVEKAQRNIPGSWLTNFFISLRPFELVGMKYLKFMDELTNVKKSEKFLRVEKWLHDAPDQAGHAFVEFIRELYQSNKLIKGEFCIAGNPVNLSDIKIPVLNIMAETDSIVPMSATLPLRQYLGTKDCHEQIFKTGHIGLYISDKAATTLPSVISKWL